MKNPWVAGLAVGICLAGALAGRAEPSRVTLGFAERLRFVTWDYAQTLDKEAGGETAYTLHRTSFSLRWQASPEVEVGLRLVNESRFDIVPEEISKFRLNELFVDNLYLVWQKPLRWPVRLTVGRQDFVLGEGFLIADGTPLDETRSAYFNGLKLEYFFSEERTLTAFYLHQRDRETLLPVVNGQAQALLEHPQSGLGLDYRMTFGRNNSWDAYLLSIGRTYRNLETGINFATLGSRLVLETWRPVTVTAEAAFEFGQDLKSDGPGPVGEGEGEAVKVRRSAFGGYVHVDYRPDKPLPYPEVVTVGGIYLSGDDRSTEAREDWDPVFGRWPKWSESYIYTLTQDRGMAWWTNTASVYGSVLFKLTSQLKAGTTYHRFLAPRRNLSADAVSPVESRGRVRGDLFIVKLEFALSKAFTGRLLWEAFSPGSFTTFPRGGSLADLAADGYDFLLFEFTGRF